MASNTSSASEGLLENGLDSIRHAMDHFSARNSANGKSKHDDKWIVLSVHHAAECVCNALLLKVEPSCSLFQKGSTEWYPSLTKTIKRLQFHSNRHQLAPAEVQLLLLLNHLPDIRHQFMHRVAPEDVDVSIAAMCLIGILKHLEVRYGKESSDIAAQSPAIETDIVASIRYHRLEEYTKFVELFLREKYADLWLNQCPSCAAWAVRHSHCEVCFEEMESITCPECDSDVLFLPWEREVGTVAVECQDCGKEIKFP